MLKRTHKAIAGVEFPVIAGYDAGEDGPTQIVLAQHQCSECGTVVTANKMAAPSCVCCGASTSPINDEVLVLSSTEVQELPSIGVCSGCDTHFHAMPAFASAIDSHSFHCPVCATVVEAELDGEIAGDEDEEMPEDSEMSDLESGDEEMVEDEMSDDSEMSEDSGMGEDELDLGADVDMGDDSSDEMSDDSGDVEDLGGEDDMDAALDSGDESDLGDEEADMSEDMGDDSFGDEVEEDEGEDSSELPDEESTIEARVIDYVNAASEFELVMAGAENAQWYLFADSVPVAIASRSQAKASVQAFFATEKFRTAFVTAAEDGLTDQTLNDFGFEPVKIDVPVDKVTEKQVQDAIAAATADLNEKIANITASFQQALGIAAVGVNKGMWNTENPLIAALVSELSRNRVRNPERLVEAAFAEHGEDYLKVVVAKAVELVSKSPETRNEVASMVLEAKFRHSTLETVTDEPRTRVVSFMTSASEENHLDNKPAPSAITSKSSIDAVVASLGNRRI